MLPYGFAHVIQRAGNAALKSMTFLTFFYTQSCERIRLRIEYMRIFGNKNLVRSSNLGSSCAWKQGTKAEILSWEHRRLLIHAAKTALAATFSWWLALRFGLRDGYWGAISSILVLQSNVGATVTASRDRAAGHLDRAALGFLFSLFGPLWLSYFWRCLAAIIVCGLLDLRSSSRLAGVTVTIVMLVHKDGPRWGLALNRTGDSAARASLVVSNRKARW